MQWIAISGSWRKMNKKLESDVRNCIKDIFSQGNGIVSGGALNVDYIATDEMLELDPSAKRIKIFLPTSLKLYAQHYRKRASEKVITKNQAEMLITQLEKIQKINPKALDENHNNKIVDTKTYYQRNSDIIKVADGLIAFHVNESLGTKDTINKAYEKGVPVKVYSYDIN